MRQGCSFLDGSNPSSGWSWLKLFTLVLSNTFHSLFSSRSTLARKNRGGKSTKHRKRENTRSLLSTGNTKTNLCISYYCLSVKGRVEWHQQTRKARCNKSQLLFLLQNVTLKQTDRSSKVNFPYYKSQQYLTFF